MTQVAQQRCVPGSWQRLACLTKPRAACLQALCCLHHLHLSQTPGCRPTSVAPPPPPPPPTIPHPPDSSTPTPLPPPTPLQGRALIMDFVIDVIMGLPLASTTREEVHQLASVFMQGLFVAPLDLPGTKYRKALQARPKLVEVRQPRGAAEGAACGSGSSSLPSYAEPAAVCPHAPAGPTAHTYRRHHPSTSTLPALPHSTDGPNTA
jgi:hypothetical protein